MSTRRRPGSGGKKGPTKGSGGQGRKKLEGRGPTPRAEDRTWHKNYRSPEVRAAQAGQRRRNQSGGARRGRSAGGSRVEAVAGRNPVVEALQAGIPATALYLAVGAQSGDERIREALQLAAERGLPVLEASMTELDRLTRDAKHQGMALTIPPYEYADGTETGLKLMADFRAGRKKNPPLIIALDSITDPRNLGAIIRSAAAFSADAVVLPSRRSVGMTATAWKTSAGAAARVPVTQVTNLNTALEEYKKAGMFVIGLDGDGDTALPGLELATEPLCVVVGSEGNGLSRLVTENCDQIVSIPIAATTESLNASMAVGITLYEISQLRSGGQKRS